MSITNGYWQSDHEQNIDFVSVEILKKRARKIIPKGGYDYIVSGSGDEWTLHQNVSAFNDFQVYPRVLTNLEDPQTETEFLGIKTTMPVMAACPAAQGLAHAGGEKETAKGIAAAGTIMCESTYSSCTVGEICDAAPGAPNFFDLYAARDWKITEALLKMAKDAGCKAIIWTVDAAVVVNREADELDHFVFPLPMPNLEAVSTTGKGKSVASLNAEMMQAMVPSDIGRIRDLCDLPVIVKGIQHPDDAQAAIEGGAAAVWVSNHGGRQLNGGPASISVLPEIAERVSGKVPIIFDSGVRSAADVFKAIALGADMVALGRPILYALAVGGAPAVEDLMAAFRKNLKNVMQLAGAKTVADIQGTQLRCS